MKYALLLVLLPLALLGQESTSNVLVASAETLISQGKNEKAKSVLFQALALDETNGMAILSLAKLLAKDRDAVTGELLFKAYPLLPKTKKEECMRLMVQHNPAGAKILRELDGYAAELLAISKRFRDPMTIEELNARRSAFAIPEDPEAKIVALMGACGNYVMTSGPAWSKDSLWSLSYEKQGGFKLYEHKFRIFSQKYFIVEKSILFEWRNGTQWIKVQPQDRTLNFTCWETKGVAFKAEIPKETPLYTMEGQKK
jgi:hypothetical protein